MSWKQTAQHSIADRPVVEHKSLSELDDVHNIINWKEMKPPCPIYTHLKEVCWLTRH